MTEIVFRSDGAVEMTLSTNNRDPARICGLTSTAMSAFGCFGQVGDSIAVEESREGVIGRTPWKPPDKALLRQLPIAG